MSIVFAAIAPHPPLLIPAIGKENISHLKATDEAYKKLQENLYVSKADTILIISPHGLVQGKTFSMNLSPEYTANFEHFGDFATKFSVSGNVGLTHKIRENLETKAPLQLISQPTLDYGSAIPLYLLLNHNFNSIKVIPLYYSGLDLDAHFQFGKLIKRDLIYSQNRIAIIASGDLSHSLSKESPAGFSPKAAKFDQKVIECVIKDQPQELLNLNSTLIHDANECGLKSILILMGILEDIKHEPQRLSYESPFGVGYLTVNFKL
ncbi:AmmeMemoRadiSam system protein B [Candidatus Falkowbacteria bacterium]|nr:AmmeMemoRadiSam system protein B [Candidatus Falkowbacteria bacterium]